MSASSHDPWAPAPVFLRPISDIDDTEIDDLNLSKMDDDPFSYFLTPTPSAYRDDEDVDFDMDFDAGIESPRKSRRHHASHLFRSISPPSLTGFTRRSPSPSQHLFTPPRSPDTPELDYDFSASPEDDNEQYDYMFNTNNDKDSSNYHWPRRTKNKFKSSYNNNDESNNYLTPPSPPSSMFLPRPSSPSGSRYGRGRSRGIPGRISPRSWREPSPDVWAIEEEPEREEELAEHAGEAGTAKPVDIPAAKPRKRVRFALPALEDDRHQYY
ncbi:hypothetical protein VTJ04DRAFT_7800 [Mycothermus thermophilus]|uniref:uncharacterized protein n=1 Tax=Humicola insolens TaxID=85995 RepID=UPI00374486A2